MGFWWMLASVILTCALALWLAKVVFVSVPNVPFWDEWDVTPIVARAHLGTLSFADLWVPHNEHRMLFPGLLVVLLDHFGGWSQVHECFVSVALAIGTLALYANLLRARFSDAIAAPLLFAGAILTLSPAQWENWLWGFQTAWLLINFSLFITVWFLSRPTLEPLHVLAAMFAATVGAFSSAFGLCILVAGCVVLLARDDGHLRALRDWIVFSGLVVFAYLFHFSGAAKHATDIAGMLHFAVAFAGAAVARFAGADAATIVGLVAIGVLLSSIAVLARMGRPSLAIAAPFLGLMAFGLATGAMTGLGRGQGGPSGALTSRYYTTATTVWLGLLPLLVVALRGWRPRIRWAIPAIAAALALAFCGSAYANFRQGIVELHDRRDSLLRGWTVARHFDTAPDGAYAEVYPNADRARTMMEILAALHDGPVTKALKYGPGPIGVYPAIGSIERATVAERDAAGKNVAATTSDRLTVAGWAADPIFQDPGRGPRLVVDGAERPATIRAALPRPDVEALARDSRALPTGFEIVFPLQGLRVGEHEARVCVQSDVAESCYALGDPVRFHIVARRSPGAR